MTATGEASTDEVVGGRYEWYKQPGMGVNGANAGTRGSSPGAGRSNYTTTT